MVWPPRAYRVERLERRRERVEVAVAVLGQKVLGVLLGLLEVGLRVHRAHVLLHHHVSNRPPPEALQPACGAIGRSRLLLVHSAEEVDDSGDLLGLDARLGAAPERPAPPAGRVLPRRRGHRR
eukprot:7305271-Prymnesium_polylepis.2